MNARALTILQPWASLIVYGFKPHEYRSWKPPQWLVGKRMVIHAGSNPKPVEKAIRHLLEDDEHIRGSCGPTCEIALIRQFLTRALDHRGLLPLGAGLGTAIVGAGLTADLIYERAGLKIGGEGPWNIGWPMLLVRKWDEPIACRGFQGLWEWPWPLGEGQ